MVASDNADASTEDTGGTPIQTDSELGEKKQPRRFLRPATRDLSEEELGTPAARRFLIAEIERLDADSEELKLLQKAHYDLGVRFAKLEEGARTSKCNEILSFVCLSVGSAGIGAAPSYLAIPGLDSIGWVFAIGSGLLVLVGILSKVFR